MDGSKYLYLGLALACFVGILSIFVVDGYLGVYDTLYISYAEYENRIEFDGEQHYQAGGAYYGGEIVQGELVHFRYRIDNRTFSPCEGQLQVSLWKGGTWLTNLVDKGLKIPNFDKLVIDWTLSPEELPKADWPSEEYANYTVKISFAGKERKVVFGYRTRSIVPPPKPVSGI
jgi:hypothetical protein